MSTPSQCVWYYSDLPKDVIDIMSRDLVNAVQPDQWMQSCVRNNQIDHKIRNSKNTWIESNHWICGFMWHYVMMANKENFRYDLTHISGESFQYTQYSEGMFYNWHQDAGFESMIDDCSIRKLSFVVQLSDPEDYEGGNLQLMTENNELYNAPRVKGSVIFFDARARHRVTKVRSGDRRSLVGWIEGPRWK